MDNQHHTLIASKGDSFCINDVNALEVDSMNNQHKKVNCKIDRKFDFSDQGKLKSLIIGYGQPDSYMLFVSYPTFQIRRVYNVSICDDSSDL